MLDSQNFKFYFCDDFMGGTCNENEAPVRVREVKGVDTLEKLNGAGTTPTDIIKAVKRR